MQNQTKPSAAAKAVANVSAKRDIRSFILSDQVKNQMALALPSHITPDRMARVTLTAMMRVPKLLECTQESLLNCLMQCSQFGLEPDGRRAHLIPFENRAKGVVECTLIIDWKGLAELALRSGMIAKLHADIICDKDEFAFDMGDILHHRINFREPRGEPYAAYAMAVTKTGERFVAVMTKDEIESIRNNSQGWRAFEKGWAKQSPWKDAPGEMWKKTAFRRLAKWLPLSAEFRDALDVDDAIEVGEKPASVKLPTASMFEPQSLPEPQEHSEPAEASQATDSVPDTAPNPDSAPKAATSVNHIKALRGLLKLSKKTEADLLNYLRANQQVDDSLGSLEEIAMVKPALISHLYDNWSTFVDEI